MARPADSGSLTLAPIAGIPSDAAYSQARAKVARSEHLRSGLVELQKVDPAKARDAVIQAAFQRIERMVDKRLRLSPGPSARRTWWRSGRPTVHRGERGEESAQAMLAASVGGRGIEIAHAEREGFLEQGDRLRFAGYFWIGGAPRLADADQSKSELVAAPSPVVAIPFQRYPHAFLKAIARRVSEVAYRERGVRLRIAHISRTRRTVYRRDVDAFELLQQSPRLVEGDPAAVAAVVNLAGHVLRAGGFQVEFGHVFHESEIARLLAVAEDGGLCVPAPPS